MSFENTQNVNKIRLFAKAHCNCPLGDEYYTGDIVITVEAPRTIPDYVEVQEYIAKLDGKDLIIEDLANTVYTYMKEQTDGRVSVVVSVSDAYKHMPVEVTVND